MNCTKAIHLKSFIKFITARGGEAALAKIFGLLSPEDYAVVSKPVLINAWLDYNVWWRLLVAADQAVGTGNYQLIREIGAFDAKENLNGIYRAFIAFMNPPFLIGRAGSVWSRYYDSGDMKPIHVGTDEAELWLSNWPGLPLRHELEIIGWMSEAFKMTGIKEFRMDHTTCLAKGDGHCTFRLAWKN